MHCLSKIFKHWCYKLLGLGYFLWTHKHLWGPLKFVLIWNTGQECYFLWYISIFHDFRTFFKDLHDFSTPGNDFFRFSITTWVLLIHNGSPVRLIPIFRWLLLFSSFLDWGCFLFSFLSAPSLLWSGLLWWEVIIFSIPTSNTLRLTRRKSAGCSLCWPWYIHLIIISKIVFFWICEVFFGLFSCSSWCCSPCWGLPWWFPASSARCSLLALWFTLVYNRNQNVTISFWYLLHHCATIVYRQYQKIMAGKIYLQE